MLRNIGKQFVEFVESVLEKKREAIVRWEGVLSSCAGDDVENSACLERRPR